MNRLRKMIAVFVVLSVLFIGLDTPVSEAQTSQISKQQIDRVADYVQDRMKQANIPGAAVVIVQGNKLLYKGGIGFSDVESRHAVKTNTLFELGSTSKAFTALAILKLEQEGRIQAGDSVSKYIPGFNMYYQGEKANITVEQLLNHTSGIAFKSIDKIPVNEADDALEKTVQTLMGEELQSAPGTKFLYATINYDVLGLIIQRVSGQSYEAFMTEHILKPLGMNSTYLFREEALQKEAAKGYKVSFLQARPYEAPIYRGNTPAGYIISNADDMEKWLKVQLGTYTQAQIDNALILKSHEFDKTLVSKGENWIYKHGWYMEDHGKKIYHGGNNPNFSSAIFLEPGNQIGIALLANMNSDYTYSTAKGILQILTGEEVDQNAFDMYSTIDLVSVVLLCVMSIVVMVVLVLMTRLIVQIRKGRRSFEALTIIKTIKILVYIILFFAFEWFVYHIPQLFFDGVGWRFVTVWAPVSTVITATVMGAGIGLLWLYLIAANLFRNRKINPSQQVGPK